MHCLLNFDIKILLIIRVKYKTRVNSIISREAEFPIPSYHVTLISMDGQVPGSNLARGVIRA